MALVLSQHFKDAFSSGQVSSKIWLSEELEKTGWTSDLTNIFAGWYGVTAFIILSRGNFKVNKIRSWDIKPECQEVADTLNENWVWQNWKFKAHTLDVNGFNGPYGDLVINSSTEHFESTEWFENIPNGTNVVLQSCNMQHDDHYGAVKSLDEFLHKYPLSTCLYSGEKEFVYPTWKFKRFMILGKK